MTTGWPITDLVVVLACLAGLLFLLLALAVPAETTELGGRIVRRLLVALFGVPPCPCINAVRYGHGIECPLRAQGWIA